jgi:hypothetical protein
MAQESKGIVPNKDSWDYKCSVCGAKGVKLWREYQTMYPSLFCVRCAISASNLSITPDSFDGDGFQHSETGRTDQIGWHVPAVPDIDGDFWGYTSVPEERVKWWRALPLV